MIGKNYKIVSLYSFFPFQENLILELKDKLLNIENKKDLSGLLIFASEGINGTICAEKNVIEIVMNLLNTYTDNRNFNMKVSFSEKQVFKKLKIKIKKEIVTMGVLEINPSKDKGNYINSTDWNKLIEEKNTIIIDTRNHYEVSIGTFQNSINPNTRNFSEFPEWVDNHLDSHIENKDSTNIAMFCTGGIRCEKASAFLKKKGFSNVYKLKGGILNYLKNAHKKDSLWKGECYVFDNRVSVKHKLKQGSYSICSGCRTPISIEEKKSNKYEEGVSCPNCHDFQTNSQKARFRMRQKQINLAKKSGSKHIFQKEF